MAETESKDAHASLTRRVFDHVRKDVVCWCCPTALRVDAQVAVLQAAGFRLLLRLGCGHDRLSRSLVSEMQCPPASSPTLSTHISSHNDQGAPTFLDLPPHMLLHPSTMHKSHNPLHPIAANLSLP